MNYDRVPLPLFQRFAKYLPFSSVDIVVHDGGSFILTKRKISPYKNKWHLPGSIVHRNQRLELRAKTAVKEELNLDVKIERFLGVFEDLGSQRHYISHAFLAHIVRGKIKLDFQSDEIRFFKHTPENIIPFHRNILREAKPFLK